MSDASGKYDKAQKNAVGARGRLTRLIRSIFDPRAAAHALKVLNYYNYTHAAELRAISRGKEVRISPVASFANGRNIVLGDRVRIGAGCSLWAGNGTARIVLGDDVMLGPNVMLTTSNYRFNDGAPIHAQLMNEADVIVGRDVWIGYGAVLLAGARIGEGAVIGAGAVVRGEIPAYAVVAAPPAVVVGRRARPAGAAATSDGPGPAPGEPGA